MEIISKRIKDLRGKRFGRLEVIEYMGNARNGKSPIWKCICDCGNEKIATSQNLSSGHCLSCGCLRLERLRASGCNYKHGDSNTRLYNIYYDMRARCNNKKSSDYKRYGERGISVCDEWMNSYESFKKWAINNGYEDTLTIDRIDNNGNYEPSNCRFVDRKHQANNTRSNTIYTYNGESHTLAEWADICGMLEGTLWNRLTVLNWDFEKAILTPLR